ncbi:MAG: LOG family protein [Bacteroidota bacterium]
MTVTVFGNSRCREDSAEYKLAFELGGALATAGYSVCNGGYSGTMEATARGSKAAGGATIGVTVEELGQPANTWIDQEIKMKTLMERLLKLVSLGDGYIVLQGGTGTLLELAVVWELINKGMLKEKPVIAIGTYWTPVLQTLRNQLLREGQEQGAGLVSEAGSVSECIEVLDRRMRQLSDLHP